MSDFSKLKTARKAREANTSFVRPQYAEGSDSEKDKSSSSIDETASQSPDISNGLYSSLPPYLQVRDMGKKGRGISSQVARKPGDILLSLKPHVAALSNEHIDSYCSKCFGSGTTLRRCTSCRIVHYCDSKCQSADWHVHKYECLALQKWAGTAQDVQSSPPPNDAIRCLGRILWRKQKLGFESVWAQEMGAMQSHRTSLQKVSGTEGSQLHTHLAHAIVHYVGLSSPKDLADYGIHSSAELVDLISSFTTNTFTITAPTLDPLGACVSPVVALINHSCDPNAVIVFPRATGPKDEEPLMQVIALKSITPGEEILTSYVDTTLPTPERQRALLGTYHFTCDCSFCAPSKLPEHVDLREAMNCPKKCGGICRVPTEEESLTRCTNCNAPVKDTDAVLDALRVGQEALDKAETVQNYDPQKALQLTSNLIPILLSAGLLLSSHPLLALCRLHTSLLIATLPSFDPNVEEISSPQVEASASVRNNSPNDAQEKIDEAIRAATRASTGISQLLAFGHPVRGIALAELGKLLSVDEPSPKHTQNNLPASLPTSSSGVVLGPPPSQVYPPSGPPRLKLAYDTLVHARGELIIGFGGENEGGEVGQSVRKQAVDLEKELGVWKTGVRNTLQGQSKQK